MAKMSNEEVLARINEVYASDVLVHEEPYGLLTIEVKAEKAHEIIAWLKTDTSLQCAFLTNLGAVHYPDNTGREFAVVYHLHSWTKGYRLRLKTYLSEQQLSIPTITDIYDGANWMERETYDLFGVEFSGHPNLRRILNMDEMDYFPMRKQYHLEDTTREDKDDRFFGR